jgi:2,5-diketo-D-gluconate reductase A
MTETGIPQVDLGGGVAMPMVGFGTWQMQGQIAYEAVRHALQVGYRHIDTATMYRNEEQVGRAIADSGLDRAEVFVTTKLPPGNAGRVRATIAESLKALRTDHVDLWLVHWPPRGRNLVPLWRDFLAVRDEGLTRAVGVSNYSVRQIDDLIEATNEGGRGGGRGPAVNQIPWSPSRYDEALLAAHAERGVAVEGYSPLKGTRLRDRTLAEIAAKYGVTPAQVILRWHLEIGVIVIPKSSRPERIEQNLDLFSFSLTPEEVARINRL